MQLFIAEKPSLAQAIANAIGNGKRGDGCIYFDKKTLLFHGRSVTFSKVLTPTTTTKA